MLRDCTSKCFNGITTASSSRRREQFKINCDGFRIKITLIFDRIYLDSGPRPKYLRFVRLTFSPLVFRPCAQKCVRVIRKYSNRMPT